MGTIIIHKSISKLKYNIPFLSIATKTTQSINELLSSIAKEKPSSSIQSLVWSKPRVVFDHLLILRPIASVLKQEYPISFNTSALGQKL